MGPLGAHALISALRQTAKRWGGDADELLLLAQRVPQRIRKRVMERPDAFLKLAGLDDVALDEVTRQVERQASGY